MTPASAAAPRVNSPVTIRLDGKPITLEMLQQCEGRPMKAEISAEVRRRLAEGRALLERLAEGETAIYGVNTGFGALCRQRIGRAELARLQENLVMSHAVGVGSPAAPQVVRWMLWFKLHALSFGHSGVQPAVVDGLAGLLSHDLLPEVPTRGSLGASGDLAPLAHLSLPLIGRGRLRKADSADWLDAAAAMRSAGVAPVSLGAKDGLALLNGTQFITATAAEVLVRAARLARHADLIATMSLDALRGSVAPFDERLHAVRPHPGAVAVAQNVRALMRDSQILESHRDCDKVQDPYSLRCIPAVHGACRDALQHATETALREINSVTDNPILFGGDVISGGNFHAEPMALTLDYLAIALTEWASISERRCYLLLSGHDGLPSFLAPQAGLNSGLMIAQYTAAALVSECKVLAHPAAVDSIPTSMGQEDHVSMGATAAVKCRQILEQAETVLAIELLCAAQALDFRAPLKAGVGPRAAHEAVRQIIPHAPQDREFGEDIQAALELLRSGRLLSA